MNNQSVNLPFRRAAVLGAGTMGAQIAAHLANAGLEVLLLDLAAPGNDPNRTVAGLLKGATRLKPDPFFSAQTRGRITCGNFDNDFSRLADAEWIIEAVIERLDVKQSILERVEQHAPPDAVVSSNTSGIPIRALGAGRTAGFRKRFLGTHFFNPPRYLRLLEIIPTADTDPAVVDRVSWYGRVHLGKGVVIANDVPYFVGNRIGIYGLQCAIDQYVHGGYTIEEIDTLTGPLVGRPKSGTFRTCDVVGLDVMRLVSANLYQSVPDDESRERFRVAPVVEQLVENGALGAKSGAGFYRKEGRTIRSLNLATGQYEDAAPLRLGDLRHIQKAGSLTDRLQALYSDEGRAGAFFRSTMLELMGYAARRVGEVADSPAAIDQAMRWGFGWELGPFETWDALGIERVRSDMTRTGIALPEWVQSLDPEASFYQLNGTHVFVPATSDYAALSLPADERGVAALKSSRATELWSNEEAGLIDMGDGVALFEFRSKAGTLGRRVIGGLMEAVDCVEGRADLRGMVIGNEGKNFSVGANLAEMAFAVQSRAFDQISRYIAHFQRAMQRVHYARKPVVVAAHQRTLGGGCELLMASPNPVAAAETYAGLVELGVGLIPAGAGCMRLAAQASAANAEHDSERLPILARSYAQVAKAEVSTSGERARAMGYVPPHAPIVMNATRRFHVARAEVIRLSDQGYRPPAPSAIRVLGRPAAAALAMGVYQMHQGRFISDYDQFLARQLAHVFTGGDLSAPQDVTQQYILDLEREVFLRLLGESKTQERIAGLLKTNRPVRN